MKYTVYFSRFIFLSALLMISCKNSESLILQVSNLRSEMLINHEGIDCANPKLTWKLSGNKRDIYQTAYRILAASSPEKLELNEGDLWDSGKIESDQSVLVPYNGSPLKSRMRCYWKVKVWSKNIESQWSETAGWSMGLLYENEWQGLWMGFDRRFPWDNEGMFSRLSARYFRKEFADSKEIQHATAYIIGLGSGEYHLKSKF